jgi:hypothetical protein
MLENCCYGESELMVLNMVRAGLFGQLTHGEGAYLHELKEAKFGRATWRLAFAQRLNGNLYPTHGLGPIAQYMSINRGDRFERLVSMSSPSIGRKQYARETFGPDDPRAQRDYAMGDINTSIIRTANGLTILLQYDTTTPRPYSRINLVSGTKGVFTGYPDRVAFSHEDWQDAAPYRRSHQHFLWRQLEQRASATSWATW